MCPLHEAHLQQPFAWQLAYLLKPISLPLCSHALQVFKLLLQNEDSAVEHLPLVHQHLQHLPPALPAPLLLLLLLAPSPCRTAACRLCCGCLRRRLLLLKALQLSSVCLQAGRMALQRRLAGAHHRLHRRLLQRGRKVALSKPPLRQGISLLLAAHLCLRKASKVNQVKGAAVILSGKS